MAQSARLIFSRDKADKGSYSVKGQLNININLFTAPRIIGESDCVQYVLVNQFANYVLVEFDNRSFLRLYQDGTVYGARFGNLKRCKQIVRSVIALFQTLG